MLEPRDARSASAWWSSLAMAALVGLLGLAGGGTGFPDASPPDRRRLPRRPGHPRGEPRSGSRGSTRAGCVGVDPGRGRGRPPGPGPARRARRPGQPAQAGRQDHDPVEPDRPVPGQHPLVGQSTAALRPGQIVQGVETSMFDPILEQVGLGPVERSHLSHTIGEVRETGRRRRARGSARSSGRSRRRPPASGRPARRSARSIESAVGNVDEATRRIAAASPKIEAALGQVVTLTARVDGLLAENRPNITQTIASLRDLPGHAEDGRRPRPGEGRRRCSTTSTAPGTAPTWPSTMSSRSPTWGSRCSPGTGSTSSGPWPTSRTRPTGAASWSRRSTPTRSSSARSTSRRPEDIRVQSVYDSAQVFTNGAMKLDDAVKTLEAMQSRPSTPQQREELDQVRRQVARGHRPARPVVAAAQRRDEAAGLGRGPGGDRRTEVGSTGGSLRFSDLRLNPLHLPGR